MHGRVEVSAGHGRGKVVPLQRTCDIDTAGPLPANVARRTLAFQRSRPFDWAVRAGFVTRGVTYGVIGGLAASLAVGAGSGGASPNQQGALALIAREPLGQIVLAVAAVGLLAYALWKLGLALLGTGPEGGGGRSPKQRVANVAAGGVYIAFFLVAVEVLIGSAGRQAGERGETAGVLGWPLGRLLVGIGGVVLALISLYQCYQACCGEFIDDNKCHEMGTSQRRIFHVIGRVGLVARALVFVLVGYFLCRTAIDFTTSGVGLDGTLAQIHGDPLGSVTLAFVAVGLEIFAAFSLFEARYQRL